jgi:hypothetical protein
MTWPKIVDIRGMKVPVDSWAELKEAIQEFGSDLSAVVSEGIGVADRVDASLPQGDTRATGLNHGDRTLLTQFIEAADRGLLTSQLAQALGKKGKGVRPALERWSRRIGLVTEENASAFEAVKRFDGRGFVMVDHYRRTAASMIGRPIS